MIDLKSWLSQNCSLRNYDDPDIDPDLLVSRHRRAVANAKSALRDHLKQQFRQALTGFYSDSTEEKKLNS